MSKSVNIWLEYKIKDLLLFFDKKSIWQFGKIGVLVKSYHSRIEVLQNFSAFFLRQFLSAEKIWELREFLFHKIRNSSVTNAENGQLVRAFASTIIHKRNLRMGFSLPSPAVSHPDMPFMAWVRNYQLSCIIWLYNIQHSSTLTGTSDYYTAT